MVYHIPVDTTLARLKQIVKDTAEDLKSAAPTDDEIRLNWREGERERVDPDVADRLDNLWRELLDFTALCETFPVPKKEKLTREDFTDEEFEMQRKILMDPGSVRHLTCALARAHETMNRASAARARARTGFPQLAPLPKAMTRST
jgi:hypothetical protein